MPPDPLPPPSPWPARVAWGCLGAGAAGLVVELARVWGADPGSADRALVLAAAGYAALRTPRPVEPRGPRRVLGLLLVAGATTALPAAWYLQSRLGPRTMLLWWQWAGLAAGAAGLLLARLGPAHARASAFPLAFPAFALPVPGLVLVPLQTALQGLIAAAAVAVLVELGFEVERAGFVLRLPSGDLGVARACGGAQSLTALTAVAGFVAHGRGFGPVRGAALVGFAVPVVVAANGVRVVLSALIQEATGPRFVQGAWHDALGFATVLAGVGVILLPARFLAPRPRTAPEPPAGPLGPPPRRWVGWAAAGLLAGGTVAGVGAALAGHAQSARVAAAAPPLDALPDRFPGWTGRAEPVPAAVREMLAYDAVACRVYTNNLGQTVHAWAVYWAVGGQVRGRHDPDVCWPARGFVRTKAWTEVVPTGNGGRVPAAARGFARPGTPDRHLVVCWVQDGRIVAAEPVGASGGAAGQGWAAEVLGIGGPPRGPRLMVLVGTADTSPNGQEAALALAGRFGRAVYDLCPWADPSGP